MNKYIVRNDKNCTHIHCSIFKKSGIETAKNWDSHIPKAVYEDLTVLCNQVVQTDRDVLASTYPMGARGSFSGGKATRA
jgi:hypothetical protein